MLGIPLKIGCDCTQATGQPWCRDVGSLGFRGGCNVKGNCQVGQRGSKAKAKVAGRTSLSGAQQSLKRSLAAFPGQLHFLPQAPDGLASLHERAGTGSETSDSSSGVSLLRYRNSACTKEAALPMPGSLARRCLVLEACKASQIPTSRQPCCTLNRTLTLLLTASFPAQALGMLHCAWMSHVKHYRDTDVFQPGGIEVRCGMFHLC